MILKILGMLIPSKIATKAQISALNTALSKRGETTRGEVFGLLLLKYLRTIAFWTIIVLILMGKLPLGQLIKVISTAKILG